MDMLGAMSPISDFEVACVSSLVTERHTHLPSSLSPRAVYVACWGHCTPTARPRTYDERLIAEDTHVYVKVCTRSQRS